MNDGVLFGIGLEGGTTLQLPINAVERETGISKELLRMWERRYRFPNPQRDDKGDRVYTPEDVNKLRLVRRLLDSGFRPGKIIDLQVSQLEELLQNRQSKYSHMQPVTQIENDLLRLLKLPEVHSLQDFLRHELMRMGAEAFVLDLIPYMLNVMENRWLQGELDGLQQRIFREALQSVLQECLGFLRPVSPRPQVLIISPSDDGELLGLLMLDILLRLEDVCGLRAGPQFPLREMPATLARFDIAGVIMHFHPAYPANRILEQLEELRYRVPEKLPIWGIAAPLGNSRKHIEGVTLLTQLQEFRPYLLQWCQSRTAS